MNRKAHLACNFNCTIETEGLVKGTGSDVHCTCGNISETAKMEPLLLQTTNRKCHHGLSNSRNSDDIAVTHLLQAFSRV